MGNPNYTYFMPTYDPWNSDISTEYQHIQSTYYSGSDPNITAPAAANYPNETPTRYFVELPAEIDVSDLAGSRPISIYDVDTTTTLTRVAGSPGANEYRVPPSTGKWRNVIEINAAQAGDELGYDYYSELSIITADKANMMTFSKGAMNLALTEWDTNTQPEIAAGSQIEINGKYYNSITDVSVSGSTSNSTWYDILLTPSAGVTFTASFVARETGSWSDSKQGLYSGDNRVVACVYVDGSGNFINKNILKVVNRKIELTCEIGDWNMVSTTYIEIPHGVTYGNIRSIYVVVRNDANITMFPLDYRSYAADVPSGSWYWGTSIIRLGRYGGGYFDETNFDSTSYNRGWITIIYEI
jgi:hypothetical protein